MADISKIKPNGASGTEYEIKDTTARTGVLNLNKATQSTKTISGNPITVTDAAPINAEDVTVAIEPIQDLHGYDKPWVGGAWKNLLPMTVDIIKSLNTGGTWNNNTYSRYNTDFEILTDSNENVVGVKVTGTPNNDVTLILNFVGTNNTEYILNGCPSGGSSSKYRIDTFGNGVSNAPDYGSGVTFTSSGNSQYARILINNGYTIPTGGLIFYPMIRLASITDSTFAPYTNICPISGWDSVNVWLDAKHKAPIEFNQLVQNGDFADTSNWYAYNTSAMSFSVSSNKVICTMLQDKTGKDDTILGNTSVNAIVGHIYLRCVNLVSVSSANTLTLDFEGAKMPMGTIASRYDTSNLYYLIYRASSNDTAYKLRMRGNKVAGDKWSFANAQCFDLTEMFGETEADYIYSLEQANAGAGVEYFRNLFPKDYYAHNTGEETCVGAVNGDPYTHVTVSLSSAGTVYSGTLDVTTGKLVVDKAIITLSSPRSKSGVKYLFNYDSNTLIENSDTQQPSSAFKSNKFAFYTIQQVVGNNYIGLSISKTSGAYYLYDTNTADMTLSDAQTYYGNNPIQVMYPLATPQTYTLTPTQIKMLLNNNTVYADCGDITLKYQPDNVVGELKGRDNAIWDAFKANDWSAIYSAVSSSMYQFVFNLYRRGGLVGISSFNFGSWVTCPVGSGEETLPLPIISKYIPKSKAYFKFRHVSGNGYVVITLQTDGYVEFSWNITVAMTGDEASAGWLLEWNDVQLAKDLFV